jgi:dTDP-4-dehydrorhamnose 3,5-epimerase
MKVSTTEIQDCLLFETQNWTDERGYFRELFNQTRYELGRDFKQVNCSVSHKDVVRGMHITPFAKLVSCVKGRVFDVAIDPRPDSPTFLKWTGCELSPVNGRQLFVPPFCGHGFMALEDDSIVVYLQDSTYDPKVETSIHWLDPTFAITWPAIKSCIVSAKDDTAPQMCR